MFWDRGPDELNDYEKYVAQIEKGEQKIQRRQNTKAALELKVSQYKVRFECVGSCIYAYIMSGML